MIIGGNSSDGRWVKKARSGDLRKVDDNSTIQRRRTRKILTSVLLGAVLSSARPLVSYANTLLLTETNNAYISSYSLVQLEPLFGNSASATRLLVDPFPSSSERISAGTKRQLAKERALQDSRLEQCRESPMDWEQCFFFGSVAGGHAWDNYRGPSSPNSEAIGRSNRFGAGGSAMIKTGIDTTTGPSKIPTW